MEYFDLANHIKLNTFEIKMPSLLWKNYNDNRSIDVYTKEWHTFKFADKNGEFNEMECNASSHAGGIYCFYIYPAIIPVAHKILVYVGRAQNTDAQNLNKRIKEYCKYIKNEDKDRPKLSKLFYNFKEYLYCAYIELDDNDQIKKIEEELLDALLPLANSVIPDKNISAATRAAF